MNEQQELLLVRDRLAEVFRLPATVSKTDFIDELSGRINELILHDFTSLVNILYRVDVDEAHLKEMLRTYEHDDAGYIIAQLIIERERKKLR